ncbi:hypothetical protein Y032_0018g3594 [Ancylostoma ceylanicum]|uniref:Uncharacterized protein n=1 Tax=Ancylostoma ceylanicum TaxID=53326 RepID=A0A016V365_9BILA|nr:hypothetical protein Y032_0018g3594 [Ancylostoma ceylanicum]
MQDEMRAGMLQRQAEETEKWETGRVNQDGSHEGCDGAQKWRNTWRRVQRCDKGAPESKSEKKGLESDPKV